MIWTPEWKEGRLGIQLLPLVPITDVLFSDVAFVKELAKWTLAEGEQENWRDFVYALEGIYDQESGLKKIRKLKSHCQGNSLTNLLWWIHSRGDDREEDVWVKEECERSGNFCWLCQYSD
ncbi:hypothetical protein RCOM_0016830 [Ricinus communis]|uniref:glucan endo-1,3-beta-D-glucosidase n=1 Tax=Ricinus communis TaxID=3988 RepID=B9T6T0_RICCO|nr:hypothetical protein RCOM_0016830 [Ricinus communis]